jgi:hypothetical protein
MESTKEMVERILREENLLPSDAADIFTAMGKILYETAQRLKASEPYAVITIRQLEEFSRYVDDYDYFLENN